MLKTNEYADGMNAFIRPYAFVYDTEEWFTTRPNTALLFN